MTMLKDIYIEFLGKALLTIDRLEILDGDKIAIIGANGSGKTTLLNLISGHFNNFSGIFEKNHDFLYLKQIENNNELGNETNYALISKMGGVPYSGSFENCSGGEKIRLGLSNVIKDEFVNLMLDEPTTNLDLSSVKFLMKTLKNHQGTIIFTTHDRNLVEEIATKIWVIENHKVKEYKGSWTDYTEQKQLERATVENINTQIDVQKEQLQSAIQNKREALKRTSNVTSSKKNKRINPGRLGQSKSRGSSQKGISRQIKSLEKKLENIPMKKGILENKEIQFPSMDIQKSSRIVMYANELTIHAGDNMLLYNTSFQIEMGEKVAFVGNNGVGKTTLLNHIYHRHEAIIISSNVKFSYLRQDFFFDQKDVDLIHFVMNDTEHSYDFVVDVLEKIGFDKSDLVKQTTTLSAGEQLKALLATSLLNRSNVLILDEPTNYLDIDAIQGLEQLIKQYPGTILFTSHDSFFVDKIATVIYEISQRKLKRIR